MAHDRSSTEADAEAGHGHPPEHAGGSTSERLIEAGWDLIDDVGIREALRTISVADIAQRAERSERTFWNHFETWDAYVEALISNIPRRGPMEGADDYAPVSAVDEALVAASREALPELVRAAARANWEKVTGAEELTAFRRQLLLASREDPEGRLQEVLGRDYYGAYLPMLQRIYEDTAARSASEPISPFDFEDFTRIIAALSEGLLLQYMASPARITTGFVVDVTAAVVHSLLRPLEQHRTLGSIEAEAAAGPAPLGDDPELLHEAARCIALCESAGRDLQWSQVADATGSDEMTVRRRFQRTDVVAALGFGSVVLAATVEPVRRYPDGVDGQLLLLTDCLCALVRAARHHPWGASRLLVERLGTDTDAASVRKLVPVGHGLANQLGEDPATHHERIVNATLATALSDRAASPAEASSAGVALHPSSRARSGA